MRPMSKDTSTPVDPGTRAFLAVRELATEARAIDGDLAGVAEFVANLAIGALQGLRIGAPLVDVREIAALRKACEVARGHTARVWRKEIEHAGTSLKGTKDPDRRYAIAVGAIVRLAATSVDPKDHDALSALAWPDRFEATADLLATCTSEPSKKGKQAGAAAARQWESIAVELLIRAGIQKPGSTKAKDDAKRKELRQKFQYWAEKT